MFEMMVWAGAALTLAGLVGLIWCIVKVMRARRAGLTDEALRAEVQKILPLNLGALAISGLGLMLVVVGVFLA